MIRLNSLSNQSGAEQVEPFGGQFRVANVNERSGIGRSNGPAIGFPAPGKLPKMH